MSSLSSISSASSSTSSLTSTSSLNKDDDGKEGNINNNMRSVSSSIWIAERAFGKKFWDTNIGQVTKVPELRSDIGEILEMACPFWGIAYKIKDTHTLTLFIDQVEGEDLSINRYGQLIKKDFPKNPAGYRKINPNISDSELGARPLGKAFWGLTTKRGVPGTKGKSLEAQVEIIASLSKKANTFHAVPTTMEAIISISSEFYRSNKKIRLFGLEPQANTYKPIIPCYTRCWDQIGEGNTIVGAFSKEGLVVDLENREEMPEIEMMAIWRL